MFEALSDRFEGIFTRLRGRGRLNQEDVDEALREIRMALLQADVNLLVVRDVDRPPAGGTGRGRAVAQPHAGPAGR